VDSIKSQNKKNLENLVKLKKEFLVIDFKNVDEEIRQIFENTSFCLPENIIEHRRDLFKVLQKLLYLPS
jgi:hypothetical protein